MPKCSIWDTYMSFQDSCGCPGTVALPRAVCRQVSMRTAAELSQLDLHGNGAGNRPPLASGDGLRLLRLKGNYRLWVRRARGHGSVAASGRTRATIPGAYRTTGHEDWLAQFLLCRGKEYIKAASDQPESGTYSTENGICAANRSHPQEDHIRVAVSWLAAYDATILWGPGVFKPGGIIKGANTALANPSRTPIIYQLRNTAELEHKAQGLVASMADYLKLLESGLRELEEAKIALLQSTTVPAAGPLLLQCRQGRIVEAAAALSEIPRSKAAGKLRRRAERYIDTMKRAQRLERPTSKIIEDVRQSHPTRLPPEALELVELLDRLMQAIGCPQYHELCEILQGLQRMCGLGNGADGGLPTLAVETFESKLDAARPGAVSDKFYWRVHQMLLLFANDARVGPWLSDSFDWRRPERIRQKITESIKSRTAEIAACYSYPTTTVGHHYINAEWAPRERGLL